MENKIKRKFSLLEISGAFGDWGTLIPYIIGYVSIVGFNPASIFICLGITNIILGIKFNLPLPVQPQKTIGAIAIANAWNTQRVISTGFGTGLFWLIASFSKKMNSFVKKIPKVIVKAIQMGLALILTRMAFNLLISDIILSIVSFIIILFCILLPKVPSALLLTILGIFLIIFQGNIPFGELFPTIPEFTLYLPSLIELGWGMLYAGIAQLILTFTNVMVATVALANELFPDREHLLETKSLAFNMGIINTTIPFLGGMPLCHGSGGLAAQYQFGARTGGSMIVEGIIELIFGLFFSNLLFSIFIHFPNAIFGVMLIVTAFLLGRVSLNESIKTDYIIIVVSAIFSFIWSIIIGFIVALVLYFVIKKIKERITN